MRPRDDPSRADTPRRAPAALAAAAVLCVAGACAREAPAEPPPRWNVLLVSLDTCRADRLSCYGHPRATPAVDRLAREGVLFRDCVAQSTITAPSHLSILTGQHVARHGLGRNLPFPRPPYTLATVLGEAGWETAAFTGHGPLQASSIDVLGFGTVESWVGPPRAPLSRDLDEVLPGAVRWLDERGDAPFFLFVHAFDPHCPYWPDERFREPAAAWYEGPLDPRAMCGPDFAPLLADGTFGPDEKRLVSDLYDAEVAAADAALGRFLVELDRRSLLADTLVVFTSDHGEVLGDHGRLGHGRMYEEELRVPLVLRFPGGRPVGVVEAPVQHVDLVPTVLSALGLAVPDGVQGVDLMPLVRGEAGAVPADRLRVSRTADLVGVRGGGGEKAVFELVDGEPTAGRLFDLARDPGELDDLSATPAGRGAYDRLLARWRDWKAATAEADARWRGRPRDAAPDAEMLQALGYAGDGGVDGED